MFRAGTIFSTSGGEGGIRTHGTVARTAVFKTAAFNHSATSPRDRRSISPRAPACARRAVNQAGAPVVLHPSLGSGEERSVDQPERPGDGDGVGGRARLGFRTGRSAADRA